MRTVFFQPQALTAPLLGMERHRKNWKKYEENREKEQVKPKCNDETGL